MKAETISSIFCSRDEICVLLLLKLYIPIGWGFWNILLLLFDFGISGSEGFVLILDWGWLLGFSDKVWDWNDWTEVIAGNGSNFWNI